ncbi:hypothetical protein A9Q81_23870 [Gammaproteobacteria bacterium 42_54_T18]|nr:hypothetical protein A9Q81_23870 [Gammaproteobacteria bacterium 42_54_T18]
MNIRRWSITVFLSIAVFSGLAAFKVSEIKAAIAFGESFPEHSETVETTEITTATYTPSINVIGDVLAPQHIDIRNELPGKIAIVNFESGEHVSKGQVLLQLDISIEEANLVAARARAELSRSVHKRASNLHKSKAISQEQLDRSKADLATSLAEIKVLESTISKKTIQAPFAGRTGIHQFEVGQYILDNTQITTLVGDKGYMWIDFKIPEFYPALTLGTDISTIPIYQQKSDTTFTAFILAEDTVISDDSRSRRYRAKVENTGRVFTHKSSVNVSVPIRDSISYLAVPTIAIQNDNLGQFIYVLSKNVKADGFRAIQKRINTHAHKGRLTLIEHDFSKNMGNERLTEGAIIAVAGSFKLHEGMLVYTKQRPSLADQKDNSTPEQESL